MGRFRIIVIGALLAATLTISGCKKRKPPVPPPQAQAPTITEPETPTQPTTTETQPTTVPEQPQPEPTKPTEITKPKPKTHIAKRPAKKPAQPTRIIVEDGGKDEAPAPPPPLVADSSANVSARQRQTEALLNSSEHDVATLNRQLSNDEQAIVRHIRSYVDESRQALKVGDVDRAYNLAVKAHLLSDSLKK